ncbi:MAG TPA: hypothetical protein VF520_10120 [Thermoleophilaceae bacterium]|jgi:hypothetical protein
MDAVLRDHLTAPISDRLRGALTFLERVTQMPDDVSERDVAAAVESGCSPEDLLDALEVGAAFNVIDRIADAVEFEPQDEKGLDAGAHQLAGKRGYAKLPREWGGPDRDRDAPADALARAVLGPAGCTPLLLRLAAFEHGASPADGNGRPSLVELGAAGALVDKVAHRAWEIEDEDVAAARAGGLSEHELFDLIAATATGAGVMRRAAGVAAIERYRGGAGSAANGGGPRGVATAAPPPTAT